MSVCVNVCVSVCECVCIYIYIYMCVYVYVYVYVCMYVCMYACMYVSKHVCVCLYTHVVTVGCKCWGCGCRRRVPRQGTTATFPLLQVLPYPPPSSQRRRGSPPHTRYVSLFITSQSHLTHVTSACYLRHPFTSHRDMICQHSHCVAHTSHTCT